MTNENYRKLAATLSRIKDMHSLQIVKGSFESAKQLFKSKEKMISELEQRKEVLNRLLLKALEAERFCIKGSYDTLDTAWSDPSDKINSLFEKLPVETKWKTALRVITADKTYIPDCIAMSQQYIEIWNDYVDSAIVKIDKFAKKQVMVEENK